MEINFAIDKPKSITYDLEKRGEYKKAAIALNDFMNAARNKFLEFKFATRDTEASPQDLVDVAYLYREIGKMLDELRIESNACCDAISFDLADYVSTQFAEDPSFGDSIKGSLATGAVDPQVVPIPPKKGTPEYRAFCTAFGISEVALENGLAKVSYTDLAKYLAKLEAEGKPFPFKLISHNKPTMKYRKHRGVEEKKQ